MHNKRMKILITNPIDPDTITELEKKHDTICEFLPAKDLLKSRIADREVLIFRSGVSITAEVMECAPELCLIVRAGSGIDNLDVEYVRRRGLKLVRIPGPSARAVAEMTFALILALSRNLLEADRSMRDGRWIKQELAGYLLAGKVLGIIGAGNIGSKVGKMGKAWDMEVIAYDKYLSEENAADLEKNGIRLMSYEEVIRDADYLSIHVSKNDSTRNMIDADVLSRMKPGSYLTNLARGGIVDEHALYETLTEGDSLKGAALDVHEREGEGKLSPLAGLSNVILTPHIGAMAVDSQHEIGCRIVEVIDAFATGETDLEKEIT